MFTHLVWYYVGYIIMKNIQLETELGLTVAWISSDYFELLLLPQ